MSSMSTGIHIDGVGKVRATAPQKAAATGWLDVHVSADPSAPRVTIFPSSDRAEAIAFLRSLLDETNRLMIALLSELSELEIAGELSGHR